MTQHAKEVARDIAMGIGDLYTNKDEREAERRKQDSGRIERAATHEPAPTGTGAVILPFATERAQRKADWARARGDQSIAKNFELVRDALTARAEMGKAKYGTYLRAHNDRNPLVDMVQEVLDAIMYGEQCKFEMDQYKYEDCPVHLIVGAEHLDALYLMAAEMMPYIEKAA